MYSVFNEDLEPGSRFSSKAVYLPMKIPCFEGGTFEHSGTLGNRVSNAKRL